MEVNVENPAPCLARITFVVPAEEFQSQIQRGLRHARQHSRMKGFRPGKAPLPVVERMYGDSVREDTKQHFVRLAFEQAVKDRELRPLGNPRLTEQELADAALNEGGEFAFEFEADLRPTIELGELKGLAIESELAPVMDQEVEAALEQFRRRNSRPEPAGEEGLGENGMAIAKVELLHEEEVVLEREGMRIGLETPLPGVEETAWREKLSGAVEGGVVELPVVLPAEIEKEEARGTEGLCRLELSNVYDLVPPTEEELCQLLDVEDNDALQKKAREQLEAASLEQEEARIEGALFQRVVESHDFEVPERMIEDQAEGRRADMRRSMESQDVPAEEIERQLAEGEAENRTTAERGVRAFFMVEAIAQAEELQATEEDLRAEFGVIAARNQAKVEDVIEFYREQQQINQLALEIVERKVRRLLRDSAEITEPS